MFPSQTQRVLLLIAVAIAVPAWWWLAALMPPGDGLGGWSFVDSTPGPWVGAGLVLLGALPALAATGFIGASGNPLTGVLGLVLAGAIVNHGNTSVEVARRAHDHGKAEGLFISLTLEALLGVAVLTALLAAAQAAKHWWTARVPQRLRTRHLGQDINLLKSSRASLIAGLITAAVGLVLTTGLLRGDAPGQIVGGLVLAFTIAALIGHAVAPHPYPWATLAAPALVAVIGYTWAQQSLGLADNPDALLTAWYAHDLPGPARGLPLHYLTAGVLGCTIGLGLGQVIEKSKRGIA